ncbi:hypothetical protein GCM10022238_23730 [Gordonia hankookensis]
MPLVKCAAAAIMSHILGDGGGRSVLDMSTLLGRHAGMLWTGDRDRRYPTTVTADIDSGSCHRAPEPRPDGGRRDLGCALRAVLVDVPAGNIYRLVGLN